MRSRRVLLGTSESEPKQSALVRSYPDQALHQQLMLRIHCRCFYSNGAPTPAPPSPTPAGGTCFLLLDNNKPLASAPFGAAAVAQMQKNFLANINVNGTGAVIASPGAVPALKDCCPGGYRFHWMRDGALTMDAVQLIDGLDPALVRTPSPASPTCAPTSRESHWLLLTAVPTGSSGARPHARLRQVGDPAAGQQQPHRRRAC